MEPELQLRKGIPLNEILYVYNTKTEIKKRRCHESLLADYADPSIYLMDTKGLCRIKLQFTFKVKLVSVEKQANAHRGNMRRLHAGPVSITTS